MFNLQEIASATLVAFRDNGSIADAPDGRSGRGGVIHAVMCPVAFQDRMETGVGEAGKKSSGAFRNAFRKLFPSSSKNSLTLSCVKGIA